MIHSRVIPCAIAAAVAVSVAVGAAPALASHTQSLTFEAPRDLISVSPQTRTHALAQLNFLGVRSLRVVLYWRDVAPAPASSRRPSFDATNPGAYGWGAYDALLSEARQRNWSVLLTVSGPVPRWATVHHGDNVTRPDPLEFRRFMTAVGRHYGSQVSLFSIWNEPNHPQFLLPQFDAHGAPASPLIYRALFQSGYAGLKDAGLANPRVLMGETAPTGSSHNRPNAKHDVSPLAFLRGALCLDSHYHKASSCSALPASGYAHHAYTKPVGPSYIPPSHDDVTIGALSRLSRALDLAARAHALRAHMGIYLTEFGVQSKPNKFLGVPVAQQAEFDATSERIAYDNPRVAAFSQYLLRDDPVGAKPGSGALGTGFIGFQTGLEYVNGKTKPVYNGFRTPLAVKRQGHRFSLWGLVRPATGPTRVDVLVQDRGSRSFRVLRAGVATDSRGYWRLTATDSRARLWRVRWKVPGQTASEGPPIRAY
jgi:hypothetical protein